ncbi:hypothetical protein D3C84_321070 [compost metagenome]
MHPLPQDQQRGGKATILGQLRRRQRISLNHGDKLAEQLLDALPAQLLVAEHAGERERAVQDQHGVRRDPGCQRHQCILHHHDGLLQLEGRRRILAKGPRRHGRETEGQPVRDGGAVGPGDLHPAALLTQAQ